MAQMTAPLFQFNYPAPLPADLRTALERFLARLHEVVSQTLANANAENKRLGEKALTVGQMAMALKAANDRLIAERDLVVQMRDALASDLEATKRVVEAADRMRDTAESEISRDRASLLPVCIAVYDAARAEIDAPKERMAISEIDARVQAGAEAQARELYEEVRPRTEEEKDLLCRWLQYYVTTEEYDRQLPGRWSSHDPESWEVAPWGSARSDSIHFARDLYQRLVLPHRGGKIRMYVLGLRFEEQKALLAKLLTEQKEDAAKEKRALASIEDPDDDE